MVSKVDHLHRKSMENEKSVLRWGGLAGILALIIWIVDMPLYGFVDPFVPDGLMRFPDSRAALAMSTILCMATAFLSVALVLALYRALRGTSLAPALFGSVFGVIGYVVNALGDVSTFFAFDPLSDLYHDPAATPEAQATVVLLWQATMGLTNTFFFVGSLFMMIGFIALGVAMLRAPAFGRRFGGGEHSPRGGRGRGRGCQSFCLWSNRIYVPSQSHLPSSLRMEGLQSVDRTALTKNLTNTSTRTVTSRRCD